MNRITTTYGSLIHTDTQNSDGNFDIDVKNLPGSLEDENENKEILMKIFDYEEEVKELFGETIGINNVFDEEKQDSDTVQVSVDRIIEQAEKDIKVIQEELKIQESNSNEEIPIIFNIKQSDQQSEMGESYQKRKKVDRKPFKNKNFLKKVMTLMQQNFNKVFKKKRVVHDNDKNVFDHIAHLQQQNEKKHLRTKQLWDLVRNQRNASKFIQQTRLQVQITSINEQKGQTGLEYYQNRITSHGNKLECLVQIDSGFFVFWETINLIMMCVCFQMLTQLVAFHSIQLSIYIEWYSQIMRGIDLMITWSVLDILYNMVRQQKVSDEVVTKHIKDSVKYMFKKGLWIDLISMIYFYLLKSIDQEELPYLTGQNLINQVDLDYFNESELEDYQAYKTLIESKNVYNPSIGKYTRFQLINFTKVFFILKVLNISRYNSIINYYSDTINYRINLRFKYKSKLCFELLMHLVGILGVFLLILCHFNYFSARNLTYCTKYFIEAHQLQLKDNNLSNSNVHHSIEYYIFNSFYFIIITLTQIGNHDPGLTDFKADYGLLVSSMMVGIVLFNYTHASLTSFIGQLIVQKQTVQSHRNYIDDQLGLLHMEFTKFINMGSSEIQTAFKYSIYCMNNKYEKVQSSPYFLELPPNLQNRLMQTITALEKQNFVHFFYEFSEIGKIEVISKEIASQIISQLDCEVIEYSTKIIAQGAQVKHLYFIKKGEVQCYDPKYNYLTTLTSGSFFGEYNILFGLNSHITYQIVQKTSQKSNEPAILLKINFEQLMKIVCEDFTTFKHLHKLSLQKFRFFNKIVKSNKPEKKIHLYEIFNFMSNIYGKKNVQINEFYQNLEVEGIQYKIKNSMKKQFKDLTIHSYQTINSMADSDHLSENLDNLFEQDFDHEIDSDDETDLNLFSQTISDQVFRIFQATSQLQAKIRQQNMLTKTVIHEIVQKLKNSSKQLEKILDEEKQEIKEKIQKKSMINSLIHI